MRHSSSAAVANLVLLEAALQEPPGLGQALALISAITCTICCRSAFITSVRFTRGGDEVIASYSGDQIYSFDATEHACSALESTSSDAG